MKRAARMIFSFTTAAAIVLGFAWLYLILPSHTGARSGWSDTELDHALRLAPIWSVVAISGLTWLFYRIAR
jgi:hypothetical protein